MPKIYINCPQGTFPEGTKNQLADELTTIALAVECLPDTAFVRSTVWIYLNEYPSENVFHGGHSGGTKVISLEVNALKGGLDTAQKKDLIEQFTAAISRYAGIPQQELAPVYILIRDVEACDWGIFGKTITLDDVRNSPADAKPIL